MCLRRTAQTHTHTHHIRERGRKEDERKIHDMVGYCNMKCIKGVFFQFISFFLNKLRFIDIHRECCVGQTTPL